MQAKIAGSNVGGFWSLLVNIPGSGKTIQIILVVHIATKGELKRIKNIRRDDVIAAWQMKRALAGGVIPENAAGLGCIKKIYRVSSNNENSSIGHFFADNIESVRRNRET